MWKCPYCDKTNLDDKTFCPYCNAPNPTAPKVKPAGSPFSPVPPHAGVNPPAQDWESRYNPNPKTQKQPVKLDVVLKFMVIAAAALLIIYLTTLLFQRPGDKSDAAAGSTSNNFSAQAGAPLEDEATQTPAPTPTPEPTRAPVVADAVTELYLDFNQTYQCSTDDFVLPYDIANEEVSWRCSKNDTNTTCSDGGLIRAGNIKADCEARYNDEIIVTGTTAEGSVLTYHVITGDGNTYRFDWSTSARVMRGSLSGYVFVSDEMVVQCNGFSVYYEYELTEGKMEANAWSVWVREDGTTWVRVQDIQVENKVGEVHDITFDHPITFNEIWIMPETYSQGYSISESFQVGYLLF